jgi:molybdopterin molybdotransferase
VTELDPTAAGRLIGEHLVCLPIESLPVAQCAGAVLRENVYAERDHPPFDRVAMDGIAIASGEAAAHKRRFRIQATQAAGEPPLTLRDATHCIEIMTGAMLPIGCDCVVPVERIKIDHGIA